MKQEKPPLNNEDAKTKHRVLFDYSTINIVLPDTEAGVLQLVPIPFNFNEPGQHVIGVYMGNCLCTSSYDESKSYLYHKMWLPTGHIIGFHGSVQIDSAIANLPTNKYELDIEYEDSELIGKTKTLKHFSIAARLIETTNYPQLEDASPVFKTQLKAYSNE
ncbi:MAG: hypothetical protein KJ847_07045 [Firmicutes bacterium]|nr:hypothetical protein [Bacillota bacterium]